MKIEAISMLMTVVGGRMCWPMATLLRCCWRLRPFSSPTCSTLPGKVLTLLKRCYEYRHSYQQKVTNVHLTPTSMWPISRLHWYCWQRYVSDFMLMTDKKCWWQTHHVGVFFYFNDVLVYVINIWNRSLTRQSCHQRILSPTPVTNIDVADFSVLSHFSWIKLSLSISISSVLSGMIHPVV